MIIKAYFENIKQVLIEELDNASKSIKVAVAWFTDEELFNKILEKAIDGISVDLVILDDEINNRGNVEYNLLKENSGRVWKISESNNNSIMHNKFCIIDKHTIITGSYNWSYKARKNHENITVAKGNQSLINQFDEEFNRILKHYFPSESNGGMFEEKHMTTEIISQASYQEFALKTEIQILKIQILGLENELSHLEKLIANFITIYDIKLGPSTIEILELKRLILEKIGVESSEQKCAKEQLDNYRDSYEKSVKKGWKKLTEDESKELKKIFRKSSKLCHPDLVNESEKANAELIFNELKNLCELNDLEGIRKIYDYLKNGVFSEIDIEIEKYELRKLNSEVNRLKITRDSLQKRIFEIRESDTFTTISNIQDQDEYFQYMILKIKNEIKEIKIKYAEELNAFK